MTTSRIPQGLFQEDEEGRFLEVPKDDYRSIRRAILRVGFYILKYRSKNFELLDGRQKSAELPALG